MRQPGIEPGPHRWQRRILTTELLALLFNNFLIYIKYIIQIFFFFYGLRESNSGSSACEADVITN